MTPLLEMTRPLVEHFNDLKQSYAMERLARDMETFMTRGVKDPAWVDYDKITSFAHRYDALRPKAYLKNWTAVKEAAVEMTKELMENSTPVLTAVFHSKTSKGLTPLQYNDLLKAAIRTDNVGIYKTFAPKDTNYLIVEQKGSGTVDITVAQSVLYTAIDENCQKVAKHVAQERGINIYISGYMKKTATVNGKPQVYHHNLPNCFIAARKRKQDEVMYKMTQGWTEDMYQRLGAGIPKLMPHI